MVHPNPDFIRPLHVEESVSIASSSNAWADHGSPFALTMPQLFLGGYADQNMSARLVQGRYKDDGTWQTLHHGDALVITAATVADTVQTEAGYQFGMLQIKTTATTIATLVVNGRAVS